MSILARHEVCAQALNFMAGVEGIEPPVAVLETAGLPLTDTPLCSIKYKVFGSKYKGG